MTAGKATGATTLMFGVFLVTVLATSPRGETEAALRGPGAGPELGRDAAAPVQGRGRGNARAELYNEHCEGCHGSDGMPGVRVSDPTPGRIVRLVAG